MRTHRPHAKSARQLCWLAACGCALVPGAAFSAAAAPEPDFTAMSLKELGSISVTSVSSLASKPARETQDVLLTVGGGIEHPALAGETSSAGRFTLQGDLFGRQLDQVCPQIGLPSFGVPPPPAGYDSTRLARFDQSGGNVLGRWTHQISEESDLSVQAYYETGSI